MVLVHGGPAGATLGRGRIAAGQGAT